MAFHVAATTTLQATNYTTPGDVTRARRAAHLRRAHYLRLARKSADARRARRQDQHDAQANREIDRISTAEGR